MINKKQFIILALYVTTIFFILLFPPIKIPEDFLFENLFSQAIGYETRTWWYSFFINNLNIAYLKLALQLIIISIPFSLIFLFFNKTYNEKLKIILNDKKLS